MPPLGQKFCLDFPRTDSSLRRITKNLLKFTREYGDVLAHQYPLGQTLKNHPWGGGGVPLLSHYKVNTINDLHVATAARIQKQAPNRRSTEGLQYFRWFVPFFPQNESNDVTSESLACTDDMIRRFLFPNSSSMIK